MCRPLLILDLDESLIYPSLRPLGHSADFFCKPYHVYTRPFLKQFIDTCRQSYNLAVWTRSDDGYARCVNDHIFDGVHLEFLWARSRCTERFDFEHGERYWIKNLRKVKKAGYDLKRVLMVDDSPRKLERNYGNLIIVNEFTGDPEDDILLKLASYLVSIRDENNFREIEKRNWMESF